MATSSAGRATRAPTRSKPTAGGMLVFSDGPSFDIVGHSTARRCGCDQLFWSLGARTYEPRHRLSSLERTPQVSAVVASWQWRAAAIVRSPRLRRRVIDSIGPSRDFT